MNVLSKKLNFLFLTSACLFALQAKAQSSVEIGIHADYVNLNKYIKNGYEDIANNYEIANPPLSIGAYLNKYFVKQFGLHVGIQFIQANEGTYNYKLSTAPYTEKEYVYNYSAVRIPFGFTGDLTQWLYYNIGANIHLDNSQIENYPETYQRMNGLGMQGEAGLHFSLLQQIVKVRLGLYGQNENMISFSDRDAFNLVELGVRARLAIRL